MPSIADMALNAHAAQQQAADLERQAKQTRARALAEQEIVSALRPFGIDIAVEDITEQSFSAVRADFIILIDVDADAQLRVTCKVTGEQTAVEMRVKPADQLYWDLPAGQTEKAHGGGVYGCYDLSGDRMKVNSLASLGGVLVRIRAAREQWTVKHAAELQGQA
jgi:hypothetical protein